MKVLVGADMDLANGASSACLHGRTRVGDSVQEDNFSSGIELLEISRLASTAVNQRPGETLH